MRLLHALQPNLNMKNTNKLLDCYTDAGWRKWNEAPIYLAHVLCTPDGDIPNTKRIQQPALSSVYIEYLGLIYAMEYCLRTDNYDVHFMNDNQTMIRQLQGRYRVKTENLVNLYDCAMELIDTFDAAGGTIELTWIPRKKNMADKYVKESKNV